MLAYPSLLLSPAGAGLTDILGWEEVELCDWLLEKDDVSKLTGDVGGVRLLHSECEREPGVTGETSACVIYSNSVRRQVMSSRPLSDPAERQERAGGILMRSARNCKAPGEPKTTKNTSGKYVQGSVYS